MRAQVLPAEVLGDIMRFLDRNHVDMSITISRKFTQAAKVTKDMRRIVAGASLVQQDEDFVVSFHFYELSKTHHEKVLRQVSDFYSTICQGKGGGDRAQWEEITHENKKNSSLATYLPVVRTDL